jgi:hypothetical protein
MEKLISAIQELQVGQQTIVSDIKATRADQKEMAAIRACQAEMGTAIRHLQSARLDFEMTFSTHVQSIMISMDESIRSLREEVSRHDTFITCLGKKQLMNTLSEAAKRGLKTKVVEAEDRVCRESSGNAEICADRRRWEKGQLLSGTKSSGTERLVCLPSGGTNQDFPEQDRPKPEKREYTKKWELATSCPPPHYTTSVCKTVCSNLRANGRIGDKPCIVTVDTGASVSITRPDMAAGLPERDVTRKTYVRSISGQTLPIFKEALVKLTMGKCLLTAWVFVADITEEFTLGLDIMYAHNAVVDLRRHVLRLGDEEVPLRLPERICSIPVRRATAT